MTNDELIKDICKKEIQYGCYNHTINGISIYNYVQRFLRKQKCREYGFMSSPLPKQVGNREKTRVLIKSTFHLIYLLLFTKKRKYFFYSFPRVDSVNGTYLDKFTDPIIDNSSISEHSYVIFEKGFLYKHSVPRYHQKNVVYCDSIDFYSEILSKLFYHSFTKKYDSVFQALWHSIDSAFPNVTYSKQITLQTILQSYISTNIYKCIFCRLSVTHFFAPGRGAFSLLIPAAKRNDVKVFELQHGVTYGESVTYSGYRDPLFTPDYFLSFGDNKPNNVYGISSDKMITIGFAYIDYLKKISTSDYKRISFNDVLVISDPHITKAILSVVCQLAGNNPSVMFHFRPHPEEFLSDEQKEIIDSTPNIVLDDNKCNIMVVLNRFLCVIGENSTVLYEALSMGKKVGKLHLGGLNPRYLNEEEKICFYVIADNESFVDFINAPIDSKPSKKLYADFKPDVFNSLL